MDKLCAFAYSMPDDDKGTQIVNTNIKQNTDFVRINHLKM